MQSRAQQRRTPRSQHAAAAAASLRRQHSPMPISTHSLFVASASNRVCERATPWQDACRARREPSAHAPPDCTPRCFTTRRAGESSALCKRPNRSPATIRRQPPATAAKGRHGAAAGPQQLDPQDERQAGVLSDGSRRELAAAAVLCAAQPPLAPSHACPTHPFAQAGGPGLGGTAKPPQPARSTHAPVPQRGPGARSTGPLGQPGGPRGGA